MGLTTPFGGWKAQEYLFIVTKRRNN